VISTTGAERPVVLLADFQRIEPARYQRDLCILDLAIPRDFDPAIADSKNVYLYTLDDLEAACQRNRRERERELPAARRIVEQETAQFMAELRHHATGPIIKRLRQGWEDSRDDELRRLFNRLPDLSDRQRDEIRKSFNKLINTLLHPPLESLRDAAHAGTLHAMLDTFKKLFHLKD
jgi:glutamyl-tRNA reductase